MIRKLCRLALAVVLLGLTSFAGGTLVPVQDDGSSVDVKNTNQFPVRVKRVGPSDNDLDTLDIDGQGGATFGNVPLQVDQVFTAWTTDGHYIGTKEVTAPVLSKNQVTLGVGARGISIQVQPRGGPGNNPSRPGPGPNPGERFAANLGIYYQPVRYADGTFGARLTRPPQAGSPAASLQLEPGDTIVTMDTLPFRTETDVLGHYDQTSMVFINIRGGQPQAANLILPPQ